MKIALFGAGGQVGREMIAAAPAYPSAVVTPFERADADLSAPGAAASAIRRLKPDAVINAAAWTAVDRAESEPAAAERVNAEAVGEIAQACREVGARLIQISTDYVFSGDRDAAPLDEEAETGPLGVYGSTKLRGEALALAANPNTVIVRTSWVYSAYGANFVKTMLRLSETRGEISVVDDQRGGPTPASSIARACLAIAARTDGPRGIYHFQGAPPASWADFAEAIFAAAGKPVKVHRIPTSSYPTPARRPLFTILDCSKIRLHYGVEQPDWRRDLAGTVARLAAAS